MLLTVGMVFLSGLIITILIRNVLQAKLTTELQEDGVIMARQLANMSIDPLLTREDIFFHLNMLVFDYLSSHKADMEYIFIQDKSGDILAHTFNGGFPVDLKETVNYKNGREHIIQKLLTEKGDVFDVASPIMNGELGIAHIGMSAEKINETVSMTTALVTGIIFSVQGIGVVIVIIFSRKITKPLSALIDGVSSVGKGDLKKRVEVISNDEVGILSRSFNKMADDLDKANTERNTAEDELKSLNEELGQVIHVTSHDLRSPLVNVEGYCKELEYSLEEIQGILKDAELPADIRDKIAAIADEEIPESVNYIDKSIRKMDSLLSGLLKLSRFGKIELVKKEIDMKSLVSDVTATLEQQFNESVAGYEISELPSCIGDESQINQIFTNLIGNALKYLDPERPGVIKVFSIKKDGMSAYCVEDNGIGISPEDQEKVFDIFHQVNSKKYGEGLGLNIAKKIVERHGGRVWVESEEGKGSKFCVSLPQKTGDRV